MSAILERVGFKPGFIAGDLHNLDSLRLSGIRCGDCGIALLGVRRRCENCSSTKVTEEVFSSEGTVYSCTIQRYPPPSPFVGVQPWKPRAVAWVDLDKKGPRILAPIEGPADLVTIGLRVVAQFNIGWTDERGREVIAFSFLSSTSSGSRL